MDGTNAGGCGGMPICYNRMDGWMEEEDIHIVLYDAYDLVAHKYLYIYIYI